MVGTRGTVPAAEHSLSRVAAAEVAAGVVGEGGSVISGEGSGHLVSQHRPPT